MVEKLLDRPALETLHCEMRKDAGPGFRAPASFALLLAPILL